jgi:hypothetical protein
MIVRYWIVIALAIYPLEKAVETFCVQFIRASQ